VEWVNILNDLVLKRKNGFIAHKKRGNNLFVITSLYLKEKNEDRY